MDDRPYKHSIASAHRAHGAWKYPSRVAEKGWKLKTFGKVLMAVGVCSLALESSEGSPISDQLQIWGMGLLIYVAGYVLHRVGGGRKFRDMIG